MKIQTKERHSKTHRTELNADEIHEVLASCLAKSIGLDLADANVTYSVHLSISSLDGLPRAIVKVEESIIDIEN